MRFMIYEAMDADYPPNARFIGRFLERGEFLPVSFTHSNAIVLTDRMKDWWEEQLAKEEGKRAPKRPKVAAVAVTPEDEEGV